MLQQAEAVASALDLLDIEYRADAIRHPGEAAGCLDRAQPDVVFNLVEELGDSHSLAAAVPAVLAELGVACTGSGTRALLATGDKLETRRRLHECGIPMTDAWLPGQARPTGGSGLNGWILKPVHGEASCGIDGQSVIRDASLLAAACSLRQERFGGDWFAEEYVEGRDMTVSVLWSTDGLRTLPAAEIEFRNYAPDRPRIVDYAAKWLPESFEARHTVRHFPDRTAEPALHTELSTLALRCCRLFGLRGYARIDFRVAPDGQPWIIDVNANPCLAPDAGFRAALAEGGITWPGAVQAILESALLQGSSGS